MIRHIRRHLHQYEEFFTFFHIPTFSDIIGDRDEQQIDNIPEESIEWPELDEIIQHFSGELLETRAPSDRILDMVLR